MDRARDAAAEGVKICLELLEEFAAIPGVAGVHLMAPGNESAIVDVLNAAAGMKRR
jgi:methylenetetrahydrofolate reductase (NADPH)